MESVEEYVANALSPSKVLEVQIHENEKMARVIVPDYQLSLAIGIKGQNARLAAKLTGWKIDIKSETQAEQEYGRVKTYSEEMHQDSCEDRLSFCLEQGVIGMKQRKIPLRKCVACQEMMPKRDLIRVVKTPEDEILIDLKGKEVWARCLPVR